MKGRETTETYTGCRQRFEVRYGYPVEFTRGVFDPANPVLAATLERGAGGEHRPRARLLFDQGLLHARPELAAQAREYVRQRLTGWESDEPGVYPGGEKVKDGRAYADSMVADLAARNLCRHSFVVAVGGGAFLDAAGFSASILHRGVRLVRLPSTALSQADSGVGVKNGINIGGVKNLIGTFSPPFAVINDLALLDTLPPGVMRDGLAEAFKVSIIKDAGFFEYLCANAGALRAGQAGVLGAAVQRCAGLHLHHIATSGDPFELGSSRPLDFGHWAAHRLESMSGYTLRHGQAVAVGIALDSLYAARLGLLTRGELERILDGLERAGLPTFHPLLSAANGTGGRQVLEGLEQFRQHLGGTLCIALPDGIGRLTEIHDIDRGLMQACMRVLELRAGRLRASVRGPAE